MMPITETKPIKSLAKPHRAPTSSTHASKSGKSTMSSSSGKPSKKSKKSSKRSKRTKKYSDSDDRLSKSLSPRGFSDVSHSYLSYVQIVQYLQFVKNKFSSFVQLHSLGYSWEHREIFAIEIDFCCPKHISALRRRGSKMFYALGQRRDRCLDGSAALDRNYVFIEGGTHAREWITISVALHCIYQFTERAYRNIDVLRKLRFLIVPIVNPDGYEYSISNNCRWRKNRHVHNSKFVGTDCNRNYNFHWDQGVSRMGSPTYKGEAPFSEPETRAVRNILVRLGDQILFLLSLHSYGQSLMYPWGYKHELPSDCGDLQMMARAGQAAIKSHKGRVYRTGSISNTFKRTIPGSIVDYAYGELGIPLTLVMELPSKEYGFQPDTALISPICRESFFGIYQMCRCAIGVAARTGLFYSETKPAKPPLKTRFPTMANRERRELRRMYSKEAITHEESLARHAAARKIPKSYHIVTLQNTPLTAEEKALTQLASSASSSSSPSTDRERESNFYDTTYATTSSTSTSSSAITDSNSMEMRTLAGVAELKSNAANRMKNKVINTLPSTNQFRGIPNMPHKATAEVPKAVPQESSPRLETVFESQPLAAHTPKIQQTTKTPPGTPPIQSPQKFQTPQQSQTALKTRKPPTPPQTPPPPTTPKPSTLEKVPTTLPPQKPKTTATPKPEASKIQKSPKTKTTSRVVPTVAAQQTPIQKSRAKKTLFREQLKDAAQPQMSKVSAKKVTDSQAVKAAAVETKPPLNQKPRTQPTQPPPMPKQADKKAKEPAAATPRLIPNQTIQATHVQIFKVAVQNELLLFEQGLRQLLQTRYPGSQPTQALRYHQQQLMQHKQHIYKKQDLELAKRGKLHLTQQNKD